METQIDEMVRRLVEQFHPERIILFGSHARGDAGPDSDVDLMVVMPFEGSRRDKEIEVALSLHDFEVAKDVVVVPPADFAWRRDTIGTLEYPASHEGVTLYADRRAAPHRGA
ncbi:MAG: nucleotidyltransferase domain-containing protein [Armatimonadetes bacterium]|nr:nucleotidyltransferase domain-containing protein [Armatimonadota bacterium]